MRTASGVETRHLVQGRMSHVTDNGNEQREHLLAQWWEDFKWHLRVRQAAVKTAPACSVAFSGYSWLQRLHCSLWSCATSPVRQREANIYRLTIPARERKKIPVIHDPACESLEIFYKIPCLAHWVIPSVSLHWLAKALRACWKGERNLQ